MAARMAVIALLCAALTIVLLLAGCATQHPHTGHTGEAGHRIAPIVIVDVPASDPAMANAVLIRAIGLVGTPYRYGGNTPETGFDCSGLVNFVFHDMDHLALPRTARDIAALPVPRIRDAHLAPGDLLFFGGAQVNHVGIYVGQGRFVHAPNSGGTVRLDDLNGYYYREHYLGARRVLR
ncbi:MAG: C40 family peptidase [Proteobacteria bacterium]|nr:C40 family peptidase [Pseudomonadota bacterium]